MDPSAAPSENTAQTIDAASGAPSARSFTSLRAVPGWRLAALCWAMAMAWGCLHESGGTAPGLWTLSLPHQDKLAHAGMHALLAWLLWRGTCTQRTARRDRLVMAARIVAFCAAYGLAIEWGQWQFTLTRSAETLDALANTVGAVVGVILGDRTDRASNASGRRRAMRFF